ncbi:hypothetical protein [Enterococcus wangshanyuanii]|uniref:Uncharacterized protein n=1 Tax=Enterococcus wangshanyuanii TaxID=2005703 RepID=A0ABQ1PJT0_9ENTE|nr:hypothetical protein [Enterococcus wangshanyuanii]GGC98210.1 hypothetical protein GCM10011573_29670 [Enterococcus wangshanyuanii]
MFNLFKRKQEKPKDYVSDIEDYSMRDLRPILGGHLKHGLTLCKSWEKEMPTSVAYWILVNTWDKSELDKYDKKLKELGFRQGRNERYYRKDLCLDEIREVDQKLLEG